MKRFYLLLSIILLLLLPAATAFAQKPKATPTRKLPPVVKANETEEFDKAVALTSAPERIAALQKFLSDFPKSDKRMRALELLVSARAEIAEEKLRLSETEEGIKLFLLAASEAPKPVSGELFARVLLQFPTNLFYRGQAKTAFEIARIIEEKVEGNPQQLLALGTFYLGVESAEDAKRLAEKVLAVDTAALPVEAQIAAYQMLGMANRLNFDLEASANAYAKALELNPGSIISKRSLAEMKRAIGKTEEAAALYREILEKDTADNTAQTGLVLSLFDAGKQTEAEAELAKSLEANPNNLFLLTGAAYWYAAHGQPDKAVDYAQKAVTVEPRYTWGQIALARALMLQKKPLEAEKALLTARQYGNFPTLDYELASARLAAGFYEEAAADLRKRFIVDEGVIYTRLGNRVLKESRNFVDLLAPERRASIFENAAADNPETAEKLKSLLYLYQKLNDDKEPNEAQISAAADEFIKGEDNAKTFRQIYVASRLLQKKIGLPKVLELTQGAVRGVDSSLDVDSPSSSVLADELFDTRNLAMQRGQLVIVPNLPRQTLLNILRGRIEEIAGWTLYQQEKPQEAGVRLKRAVGILPEKSAWWRSSLWRLGASLEAGGKPSEALDAYIRSYVNGEPDASKRIVIENLYQKINGSLEGLDAKIGAKPKPAVSFLIKQPENAETTRAKVEPSPSTVAVVETEPRPTPSPAVETTSTKVEETTQAKVEPSRSSMRVVVTSNLPTPTQPETSRTETSPTPKAEETPVAPETTTPTPEVKPLPSPTAEPSPVAETTPTPEVKTETTPEETAVKTEPSPEASPTPETRIEPTPETVAKVESTPSRTPETNPEKLVVEVTDPLKKTTAETTPRPTPTEAKSGKPVVEVTDQLEKKPGETKAQTGGDKTLFDPIVISVPRSETGGAVKPKTEPTPEEKPSETPQTEEPQPEQQQQQTKPAEEKPRTDNPVDTGEQRVRVIVTDNLPGENPSCSLIVGQTSISLLNNGGNLGVLVGYSDNSSDTTRITATSGSPDDISVVLEPEIGRQSRRAFFVIKSISPRTGIFTVTFHSPCGSKEVRVRVR
jgi:tetratricopeptide (TPR) repeat protein